jgi:polyisoprenyl-phosphate glycosyltransferase
VTNPLVSVVFSFRNEAETIPTLIARVDAALAAETIDYELIFVNDASTDASLAILKAERDRNPRVKVVNMSRRFGVAECLLAGLSYATGDAVIYMDTDLQDPPETIPAMLARWRAGADVVHTVRTRRRGENPLKMFSTRLAYRLIRFASAIDLVVDAGDFKLLSRGAVDHLLRLRETDPYTRGLVAWLGFNQVFISYERDPRHAGKTHFPFLSRGPWKAFLLGLTSFSFTPIYAVAVLAVVGVLAATALSVAALNGSASATTALAVAVGVMLWALTVASTAIVGLYVIRIYKDVRGRPPFIVQSTIGLQAPAQSDAALPRAGVYSNGS